MSLGPDLPMTMAGVPGGPCGACPGCPLRGMPREQALEAKRARFARIMEKVAGVTDVPRPLCPVPLDGYRHRTVATALATERGLVFGMVSREPPGWVDLAPCPAHHPRLGELLAGLARVLDHAGVEALSADGARGAVRHATVHLSQSGPDRVWVTLARGRPGSTEARAALTGFGRTAGVSVLVDELHPRSNATVSRHPTLLWGVPEVWFRVGDLDLRASPGAWTPVSPGSVPPLRDLVLGWVSRAGASSILEVGCGVGTLTVPMAMAGVRVLGVDQSRPAILDAEANVDSAGLSGSVRVRVGEAEHAVRRVAASGETFDAALLHGMRRPYGAGVLGLLPSMGVRALLLVSPSVGALAEDVALASSMGWTVVSVHTIDQLPGTRHLMGVVAMERVQPF